MLETPHVAVAAAIASKIPNPWIALPAAITSHFLLDRIPHWNPHSYTEVSKNGKISGQTTAVALFDVTSALALGTYISSRALPSLPHAATIFIACFLGALPDLAKSPYFLLGVRKGLVKKYVDFERSLQVDSKKPIWGIATQLIVIGASLAWIVS